MACVDFRKWGVCGDKGTTTDTMKTSRLNYLPPEIISMIAGYLPPSDILSLSVAFKSETILPPDFDKIVINKSQMIRQENYKVTLLDTDVSEEVFFSWPYPTSYI